MPMPGPAECRGGRGAPTRREPMLAKTARQTALNVMLAAGLAAAAAAPASAQTEFTYQGVLENSGSAVTGTENIRFRLYDAEVGGTLFGESTQNVDVTDGVFAAPLNLGTLHTIDPDSAWLEIAVSTGPGTWDTLGRQKITSAPFATNTRGLNVDASGRLSVGTTSHLDILHIAGNNARIMTESTSGSFSGIRSRVAGKEFFTGVDTFPGAANGGAGWHVFDNTGSGRLLALLPNGNFGIGVSIPQARLDVAGSALFDGNVGIDGTTTIANNVGIGGPASGSRLQVTGANGGIFEVFNLAPNAGRQLLGGFFGNNAGAQMRFQRLSGGTFADIGQSPAGNFEVRVNDQSYITVEPGGDVFLPSRSRFGTTFGGVPATVQVFGRASDTFAMVVGDPSGIYRLSVNNNGAVATQCGIICASDERLKEDITNLETPLDKIMALRSVSFTWKDETLAKRGTQVGFVAQEVQQVLPELIGETPDGMLGVDYASLTSVLTGAVQEQQAQIDTMQRQIAALEAQSESMQAHRSMAGASLAWPVLLGGGILGGLAVVRRRSPKA